MDQTTHHTFSRRSFLAFLGSAITALGFSDAAAALAGTSTISEGSLPGSNAHKKIYLENMRIAGTTHTKKIKTLEPYLVQGTKLNLVRDYTNIHDEYATLVLDEYCNKVGFLPQDKNRIIARMLDEKKNIYAEVVSKRWRGNWLMIFVDIYLDD